MNIVPKFGEGFRLHAARVVFLLALDLGMNMSAAEQAAPRLPRVTSASVPFYPVLPRAGGIEGVVLLRISTDGNRVSDVSLESGHRLLVPAAEENVRTWQFEKHSPTSFEATFRYRMLPASGCYKENETVMLHLPTEVEVDAKSVLTCDEEILLNH